MHRITLFTSLLITACGVSITGSEAADDGGSKIPPIVEAGSDANGPITPSDDGGDGEGGTTNDAGPPPTTPVLKVAAIAQMADVNLTMEGTLDWIYWGNAPIERKTGVLHPIGDFSQPGPQVLANHQQVGAGTRFDWTDGAPSIKENNRDGYVGFQADAADIMLSIPTTPTKQVLTWYVGGYESAARFEATFADGKVTPVIDASWKNLSSDGRYAVRFSIEFSSPTLTNLQLHWILTERVLIGFVSIKAATLSN